MVSVVIAELLSDTIMWPDDWSVSGLIGGVRKPRSTGKVSLSIWGTIRYQNLALFTICIHCHLSREFYWRAGWVEILMSGSMRSVDVLSNGRILWHSSIEREEKPGIQIMPKWESYIRATRPRISEEFWRFAARVKSDFRVRLMGWLDWSERFWQWRENLSKRSTSTAKNTTEGCQKVSYGIQPAKMIQLVARNEFA